MKFNVSKDTLWTVAKYLLALAVLLYVGYANWEPAEGHGLGKVWNDHVIEGEPIHGLYLLLALLLHLLGMLSSLLRWYVLVRAQDLPFTVLGAIRLGTLGFLCNAFLPGAVGGDVVKAAALAREQSRQTVAVATVIMDRVMSLWALILLVAVVGSICYLFNLLDAAALGPSQVLILTSVITVAISGSVWVAMGLCSPKGIEKIADQLKRVPKVGGSLSQLWQVAWLYRNRPASIGWGIVLATLSNVFEIFAFFCYVLVLWDELPTNPLPSMVDHFLLVPVGFVINGLPLFPGGAGIGEAGFGGLYKLFASAPANGVLGSLLFRVGGWLISVFVYLLCLTFDAGVKPLAAEPPDP